MNLAIIHDWLNQRGGAEDVLEALVATYPGSPVFTSIYQPAKMPSAYQGWQIQPLWTNRLPGIAQYHMQFLPVYPLVWSNFRPQGFDLILSNKSGFCHGIRPAAGTPHVCYCLTPTRYLWQYEEYMEHEGYPNILVELLRPLIQRLRKWDFAAAQRVTKFIAISSEIRARIQQFYQREATIIHPPVDIDRFQPLPEGEVGDYFLVVSRLIPYKRIDLAIEAAKALDLPLKIAGRGRDERRLRSLAGPRVEFLGYVEDAALPRLMAQCRALLFPGAEDFGIVPVQAQAAGRPVLAFAGSGALDTVTPGVSGELFTEQKVDSLVTALKEFDPNSYDSDTIRERAARFSVKRFQREIRAVVEETLAEQPRN